MSKEQSVFKTLNDISVKGKTDKKGKFTYLSWVFAWSELKKVAPDAFATVYHDDNTNMPYFSSSAGVMVKVGVTVNGIEHINYLPAMDFKNKAIKPEDVNMMDVNKAIQRATVKSIALHGLGLYIYAGEDLPEIEAEKMATKPASSKAGKVVASTGGDDFKRNKKKVAVTEESNDDI